MINHIAAKFIGLIYSAIPSETFNNNHQSVIEALRPRFPRFDVPKVNNIRLNVSGEQLNTEQVSNLEIYMVDAEGKLGIKIGNQGVFLSVDGYMSYEELLSEFKLIVEKIHSVLAITHFSQVHLRNINLFQEIESNKFEDIRIETYWGRHSLPTLTKQHYLCNGAATRHEYLSPDYIKRLQISSGVVLAGHSCIPQEEWDIWRLRGGVPVAKEVKLLIDITGINHQARVDEPDKQHIVKDYSWEEIARQLNSLHDDVNSVYGDIIIEE